MKFQVTQGNVALKIQQITAQTRLNLKVFTIQLEASALHALMFMTLIWEIYDDLILVMTRKVIVELEGSNTKEIGFSSAAELQQKNWAGQKEER
jgi:hypothetical protein